MRKLHRKAKFKVQRKSRQNLRKDSDGKEYTDEITMNGDTEVFKTVYNIPVNDIFKSLEKNHAEGTFQSNQDDTDEEVEPKGETNSNLPITEHKPPPTSKHHDDMPDMNAPEFENFLAEIVGN